MPLYTPSSAEVGGDILLASYDFTGSESTYTFSDIPQTFTHLRLVCDLRSTRAAVSASTAFFRFNGDSTAANYNLERLNASGTTASASSGIGTIAGMYNDIIATDAPANDSTTIDVDIFFYRSARNKKAIAKAAGRTATAAANHSVYVPAWWWLNTAAITSITVLEGNTSNFDSSSRLRLYGSL